MSHNKIIAIIVGVVMALALLLGLAQRANSPELTPTETGLHQNTNGKDLSLNEYFEKATNLGKKTDNTITTTFLAGGDISLSRNIAYSIDKNKDELLPFRELEGLFNSVDFSFANLESPFSSNDYYSPQNTLIFNAPKKNIKGLYEYKFKMLNLANNHAFDQGLDGIKTTRKLLTENGIEYIGTGESLNEAWQGKIIESNGIKIGFIGASYASINDGGKSRNNYVARIEDTNRLKTGIDALKTDGADIVIATLHAGTEYTRQPNNAQVTFAHEAIELGADLVIGHHPHWIQTIEKYKDKYIFYSLGNFIFDQNWSLETRQGLTLKINLEKVNTTSLQGTPPNTEISQIELIPIVIENNSTPRIADEIEKKSILKKIGLESPLLLTRD